MSHGQSLFFIARRCAVTITSRAILGGGAARFTAFLMKKGRRDCQAPKKSRTTKRFLLRCWLRQFTIAVGPTFQAAIAAGSLAITGPIVRACRFHGWTMSYN